MQYKIECCFLHWKQMIILALLGTASSTFVVCITKSLGNFMFHWNPFLTMFSTKIGLGRGLTKSGGHYPMLSPRNRPHFYIFLTCLSYVSHANSKLLLANSRTISQCLITAETCVGYFSTKNFKNALVHCSIDFIDFFGLEATNYSELPARCKRNDLSEVRSSLGSNLTRSIYLFCHILFFNLTFICEVVGADTSS